MGISQGAGRRKKTAIEEQPRASRRQAGTEGAITAGGPVHPVLLARLLDGTPDPYGTPDLSYGQYGHMIVYPQGGVGQ